jgi:hypothetical protein
MQVSLLSERISDHTKSHRTIRVTLNFSVSVGDESGANKSSPGTLTSDELDGLIKVAVKGLFFRRAPSSKDQETA